jgi:hypothetical protein
VAAPAGTPHQPLAFTMKALDAEGGEVGYKTRFDSPVGEDEHEEEHR